MKIDPTLSAKLAILQANQVGVLAWSLLAHPHPVSAGGIPGQPDPDTPNTLSRARHSRWSRASRRCLTSRRQRLWLEPSSLHVTLLQVAAEELTQAFTFRGSQYLLRRPLFLDQPFVQEQNLA